MLCCFSVCRYYFQKLSDEFDTGIVYEEARDDEAVLPRIDGKIIAKIERVEWLHIRAVNLQNVPVDTTQQHLHGPPHNEQEALSVLSLSSFL